MSLNNLISSEQVDKPKNNAFISLPQTVLDENNIIGSPIENLIIRINNGIAPSIPHVNDETYKISGLGGNEGTSDSDKQLIEIDKVGEECLIVVKHAKVTLNRESQLKLLLIDARLHDINDTDFDFKGESGTHLKNLELVLNETGTGFSFEIPIDFENTDFSGAYREIIEKKLFKKKIYKQDITPEEIRKIKESLYTFYFDNIDVLLIPEGGIQCEIGSIIRHITHYKNFATVIGKELPRGEIFDILNLSSPRRASKHYASKIAAALLTFGLGVSGVKSYINDVQANNDNSVPQTQNSKKTPVSVQPYVDTQDHNNKIEVVNLYGKTLYSTALKFRNNNPNYTINLEGLTNIKNIQEGDTFSFIFNNNNTLVKVEHNGTTYTVKN